VRFCSAAIEKRLKALPAVKSVYVDLSKKIVAVELKDGQDVTPRRSQRKSRTRL
jgi:copper chaperone CopZ